MHKKFLFSCVKKMAFWGIMGLLLFISPAVFAQTSGENIFNEALTTLYHTFANVRTIVYVTAGFGLIGVAVAAISGKLPWRWLAMISVALFTLSMAERIVLYFTDENLGSTPQSDFATLQGDSEFDLSGLNTNTGNFDNIRNQVQTDSNFELQLTNPTR